jgi:hypothetical protein
MGIVEFDPTRDGWFFDNWQETAPFDWDLYRRTYLAINPTDDLVEAPLDVAFYQIFEHCAKNGNCGGLSMLGLALYKYGGYMGFCSPASFYTGDPTGTTGPDRTDLHQAINIMQARQFSAPGIQNFVDMVKAGQLNDGIAAWNRIQSGLSSGDYCMLSLATGLVGEAAHTIIPYRADMSGSAHVLHVWDSDRPYNTYPKHYEEDLNKIVINSPTDWSYNQNAVPEYNNGVWYKGSDNGWFFAIPISLEIHKGPQPISAGFALTGLVMLLISGGGAAVTQIEDDQGRRLYTSDRLHRNRGDLETSPDRRLPGVAPWPWRGRHGGGLPGELFFLQRPPGSSPLTVSVRGDEYHITHLSAGHLTEVTAGPAGAGARDRVRIEGSPGDDQAVVVSTRAPRRRFDIHHLRQYSPGAWRSVRLHNGLVTNDQLRVGAPRAFDVVEISGITARRDLELELRRYDGSKIARRTLTQPVPAGKTLRIAPTDWDRLSRAKIEQALE